MRTSLELLNFSRQAGFELQVIGIPKTIDNDLAVTHHTPGYASTAWFFACAAREAGIDNSALPSPICILETLGRNAGWIVAATSLARAAHLIYFPERPLSADRIAADVEAVFRKHGRVVIAVCEGQRDETGQPFGAEIDRPESPVHSLPSNLGHALARTLTAKLGLRARAEKPGLIAGRADFSPGNEIAPKLTRAVRRRFARLLTGRPGSWSRSMRKAEHFSRRSKP